MHIPLYCVDVLVNPDIKLCRVRFETKGEQVESLKKQLRPAGKGFIIADTNDGFPRMRRLVEAYISRDNKKYIKLDGELAPLLPSHMFISGN